MRNIRRLLASLALAAGFSVLVTAPSAQAAEPVTLDGLALRPVQVRSAGLAAQQDAYILGPVSDQSRCLDADLNTINGNGTKVQLWTCLINPDNTVPVNQAWYLTKIPEGYYRLQNVASGRYLDADLNTIGRNGTVIQLWDYMPGGKNQWFDMTRIPEGDLRLQNVYSGRYLDADTSTPSHDGTIVRLWDYLGGAKNQWWF